LCVRLHQEQAHSQCWRAQPGSDFEPTRAVRFEANVFQLAQPAEAPTFSALYK
jgi:hypothetical protein